MKQRKRTIHRSHKGVKVTRQGNSYTIEFTGKNKPEDSSILESSLTVIEMVAGLLAVAILLSLLALIVYVCKSLFLLTFL